MRRIVHPTPQLLIILRATDLSSHATVLLAPLPAIAMLPLIGPSRAARPGISRLA